MTIQSFIKVLTVAIVTLVMALGLSSCGGGFVVINPPFEISVTVGGRPVDGVHVGPGMVQTVALPVGSSVAFDANEPVVWTLWVGGVAVTGLGASVNYGGVTITQTVLTDSRIAIDTTSPYFLGAPLTFSLVATSTLDAEQVANFKVVLTN